jgi:uncharacterized protein (DUF2267 family)
MTESQPLDLRIPVLTDVIRSAATLPGPEIDAVLAEVQTQLASRTFQLADELLRSAFAQMQATLFEQISGKLRRQLPELIDATLREHFETRAHP